MVKQFYVASDRRLSNQLGALSRQVADIQRPTGTERDQSLLKLQQAVTDIQGQQATLAAQQADLLARATFSTTPAGLTLIHGGSVGESGPVARTITLPPPVGSARSAVIYGSGSVAWTGTSTTGLQIGDSVTVGIEFRQNANRIWFDNTQASSLQMFTFQAFPTFSVVIPVTVSPSGSVFDLRMWVARTSSGGQAQAGARLEGMSFTISYGDAI